MCARRTPFIDLFLAELLAYRSAGAPVPLTAASKEKERSLSKGARKRAKQQHAEQVNGDMVLRPRLTLGGSV